jgi:hypothetical protein
MAETQTTKKSVEETTDTKTTEAKPAVKKATTTKTADAKPAVKKATTTKTANAKPAAKKATTTKTADAKPAAKKATTTKTADAKPAVKKATTTKTTDAKPAVKKATTTKATDAKPAAKKTTTTKPADAKPAVKKAIAPKPTVEKSVDSIIENPEAQVGVVLDKKVELPVFPAPVQKTAPRKSSAEIIAQRKKANEELQKTLQTQSTKRGSGSSHSTLVKIQDLTLTPKEINEVEKLQNENIKLTEKIEELKNQTAELKLTAVAEYEKGKTDEHDRIVGTDIADLHSEIAELKSELYVYQAREKGTEIVESAVAAGVGEFVDKLAKYDKEQTNKVKAPREIDVEKDNLKVTNQLLNEEIKKYIAKLSAIQVIDSKEAINKQELDQEYEALQAAKTEVTKVLETKKSEIGVYMEDADYLKAQADVKYAYLAEKKVFEDKVVVIEQEIQILKDKVAQNNVRILEEEEKANIFNKEYQKNDKPNEELTTEYNIKQQEIATAVNNLKITNNAIILDINDKEAKKKSIIIDIDAVNSKENKDIDNLKLGQYYKYKDNEIVKQLQDDYNKAKARLDEIESQLATVETALENLTIAVVW